MQIQLEKPEADLLSDVLESRLSEYRQQIASADDSKFREQLRQEHDSLEAIAHKVKQSV